MAIIDKIHSLISGSSTEYVLKDNSGTQSSHMHTKSQITDFPTIPAAPNNGTLTIQQNGTNVAQFGADSASDVTANISVPTALSELSTDTTHRVVTDIEKSTWNNMAPTNHASTATTHGVGDTTHYGHVKVDSDLSPTSTNPVQNRAVLAALNGLPTALDLSAVAITAHNELISGLAGKQDTLPLVTGTADYDIAVDTARRSGYSWYTSGGNFYGCYLAETNFPNSSSTEQLTFEAFVTIDNSSDSSGYTAGNLTMLVKVRGRGPDDVGMEIKVLSRNGFFVNNRVQPKLVVCRKTSATDYNFYIAVQFVDINTLQVIDISNRNYIYVHPLSKFESCAINIDKAYGEIPYVAYEAQPIDFSGVSYVFKSSTNSGSPASWAKAHFNGLPKYTTRFVYNQAGSEKLLIFAKGGDGYGTIVRIGYDSTAVQLLRVENGTWKTSDWEGVDAHTIDGHLISVGTYSSVPGAISFV